MNSGSTLYRYLLGAPAQQCAGGYPTTQLLPQVIAANSSHARAMPTLAAPSTPPPPSRNASHVMQELYP